MRRKLARRSAPGFVGLCLLLSLAPLASAETAATTAAPALPQATMASGAAPAAEAQSDLAATLRRIASEGPELMTHGDVAAEIAEEVQAQGGVLAWEDLSGYGPKLREPLRGRYRGLEILAFPPPGSGLTLIEALHILEQRGAPGLTAQVMPVFLKDTSTRLDALRDAVAQKDGTVAYRIAHTLHGSAANVGATAMVATCADLIREIRVGAFDHCGALIADLTRDFEAIQRAAGIHGSQDR